MANGVVLNGHSIHVPRWAIRALVVAIVVLGAGFKLGRMYDHLESTLGTMEARLCRIERAVNVESGLGCPTNTQSGAAP